MTVREVIWLWQVLEAVVLILLISAFMGLLTAFCWFIPVMLAIRIGLIGIVCLVVAWMNPQHRLTGRQFLRFWAQEVVSFCRLYCFEQAKPTPSLAEGVLVKSHHLIFAHGFMCNNGFWQPLARVVQEAGYSVSGVELESAFGDINDFTQSIQREVNCVLALKPDTDITLIGFSMGGLACRALPVDIQKRVNLITIYTPYKGTALAWIAGLVKAINGRQMRLNSPWLAQLNQTESAFQREVGLWSVHDTIVIPSKNSQPEIPSLLLKGKGHLSAAFDRRLHHHILRLLAFMSRTANSPSSESEAEASQIPD